MHVALTKQDQGQPRFSALIAVLRDFIRARRDICKARLQKNIFACCRKRNIARKLWNYFMLCTRDARKSRARNRQYAEKMELVRRATRSPRPRHFAALLLSELHDARDARLQNLFTCRNFWARVHRASAENTPPQDGAHQKQVGFGANMTRSHADTRFGASEGVLTRQKNAAVLVMA
ncbi:MAG TPA: hypothetical protein VJS85_10690 [Rhizomicrobium sp.]|nr:hypothetical protein [Rhizomicrobium sp.]